MEGQATTAMPRCSMYADEVIIGSEFDSVSQETEIGRPPVFFKRGLTIQNSHLNSHDIIVAPNPRVADADLDDPALYQYLLSYPLPAQPTEYAGLTLRPGESMFFPVLELDDLAITGTAGDLVARWGI